MCWQRNEEEDCFEFKTANRVDCWVSGHQKWTLGCYWKWAIGTVANPKVLVYYDLGMRRSNSLNLFQTAHFALKVTYLFQNVVPNDYNNPFRVPLHLYNNIILILRRHLFNVLLTLRVLIGYSSQLSCNQICVSHLSALMFQHPRKPISPHWVITRESASTLKS